MNGQFDLIERQIIGIERYSKIFALEVVVVWFEYVYLNFNEFEEYYLLADQNCRPQSDKLFLK